MTARELYDTDFFEWTRRNAELLNQGCFELADIFHIAEELTDLGNRDQREVKSYLRRLILHLLKWKMQSPRQSCSWLGGIGDSRGELNGIFEQSPSLRRHAIEALPEVYRRARRAASIEAGLPIGNFPAECPYSFEQLMDIKFLPGN